MLGGALTIGPFVVLGGLSVTKFKVYRPQLWFAWVVMTTGLGALSSVGASSPLSHAIGLSAFPAIGGGIIFATTYFPVLSPLPVSMNAQALSMFAFTRSMGQIWGISFGATMLTNQLARTLPPQFVAVAAEGIDHVYAFIPEIPGMAQPLKAEVQRAFGESVRPVWWLMTGMCGLGLVASLFMRGIPLHDYTDDHWAMGGAGAAVGDSAVEREKEEERGFAPGLPTLCASSEQDSSSSLGTAVQLARGEPKDGSGDFKV